MSSLSRKSPGFTLIEIIVVISIVGILVAVSIPLLSNFSRVSQLNKESQNIASELRLAQELAQSKKTTCRISFVSKSLFYENAKFKVENYSYFTGGYVKIKERKLPKRFDFEEDRTIEFSSSGAPSPGGSGTIILKDISGRQLKIIVSSIGRIRIE